MKTLKTTHKAPLALLAGLALGSLGAAGALNAQEGPYSYQLKMRLGLVGGSLQQDHYDNKILGFGAEAKWDMKDRLGIAGALSAELAFDFVPGRFYDVYPWDSNPLQVLPQYSYHNRKEEGQGFSLRLAYNSKVPPIFPWEPLNDFARGMEWFAGVGLESYKVTSENYWIFNFTDINTDPLTGLKTQNGAPPPGSYDGYAKTEQGSQIAPSVFAGLKCRINRDVGLEFCLRNFGMWHYGIAPAVYSEKGNISQQPSPTNPNVTQYVITSLSLGEGGASSTGASRGTSIEFALTIRL